MSTEETYLPSSKAVAEKYIDGYLHPVAEVAPAKEIGDDNAERPAVTGFGKLLPRLSLIFKSGDKTTPEGRSSERYRRILLTTIASAFARGTGVVATLISVPLLVGYLGTERYGLWMTISSVTYLLAFADFGLANGLLNAVSEAHGKDDREMAGTYIASGFFILTGVAIFLAISFAVLYSLVSWDRFFNVTSHQAAVEAGPAMAVFFACFLLNIPLGIVQRVRFGYQEGYIDSIWMGVGRVLGLAGIVTGIKLGVGLPWLIVALAGTPVIASLLNGALLFYFQHPWLRPRWSAVNGRAAKTIINAGALFFIWQAVYVVWYSSDNIIISRILGTESVAQYSVSLRLFEMIPAISMMVTSALWPAYGEAVAKGDVQWIKQTLGRTIKGGLLFSGCISLLLVLLGHNVIQAWAGPNIKPTTLLLVGAGLWAVILTIGNAASTFLSGTKAILFQAVTMAIMTPVSIILKILLVEHWGVSSVIWANVVSYSLLVLVPTWIYIPRLIARLKRQSLTDNHV